MIESKASTGTLNPNQLKAVEHSAGPLLVVAGAGTGKTRVIVERILHLISLGVDPRSILALTFTEKAAGEMMDRVNAVRGGFTLDTTIATYNRFGDELLRTYSAEIGFGSTVLLGETGQLVFMREHLDELGLDYFAPISSPDSQLTLLAGYISLLKQQLVRATDYINYAKAIPNGSEEDKLDKQKHLELASIYSKYIELCRKNNVIDYDDQLYLTIELLQKRPNIKNILQQRYQFILVDEFQDTNPMQSALLHLLAGKSQNIMVVGDDDQSIYGWRGATLANILGFKKHYPKTTEITLIENYRSSQAILDSAYRLIQNNNPDRLEVINKLNKRLVAQAEDGKQPQTLHFSSLDAEMTWIAEDIALRLKTGQDPSTISVLARRNHIVKKMHETMELHAIPHSVAGLSNDLYQQVVVNQLIETLKAINDPLDNMALFHVLGGPMFNISPTDLASLSVVSKKEHIPLSEVVDSSQHKNAVSALKQIGSWRERTQNLSVGSLAYAVMTDSGWKHSLYQRAETDAVTALQVQALGQFFKTLKEFERISDIGSLQNYLQNLPALRAAGSELQDASLDISDSLINILSVHRSKGLEWDTVYIIDCTEGSFPMRNFGSSLTVPDELKTQSEADDHMAEERRLMYVALTRAKRELVLTYSDIHNGGAKRKPSRFISELFGKDPEVAIHEEQAQQTVMELFAPAQEHVAYVTLPAHMTANNKLVLTVSQIDSWLRCPLNFYFIYVLQIPLPRDPIQQYGTIVHSCIQTIHEALSAGTQLSLETLLQNAKRQLPREGYLTARSRERAHTQALKTIKLLYDRFSKEPLPDEIEKPFRAEVPDTKLIMTGRIDAVYQTGDGGIEIRDYKTGTSVTSADKAKKRAQASNQLTLYALAWKIIHDKIPSLLTLDFVETNQQGSVRKQQKSLDTLIKKLRDMEQKLLDGVYPEGKDHTYCRHPL
ncbi:ATP-dependent helicase [Candidatus Saccharibacteria bacterium]|nr:ATP-dependent helicase [Candidatus Saccharibacteria bacterium]